MNHRSFLWRGAAATALALAWVSAQPASAQSTNGKADAKGAAYKAPRTAWGHPDLQSVWNFATPTPLERPAALANVEFLSKEQVEAAAVAAASRDRRAKDKVADVRQAYNEFWSERGQPTGRHLDRHRCRERDRVSPRHRHRWTVWIGRHRRWCGVVLVVGPLAPGSASPALGLQQAAASLPDPAGGRGLGP